MADMLGTFPSSQNLMTNIQVIWKHNRLYSSNLLNQYRETSLKIAIHLVISLLMILPNNKHALVNRFFEFEDFFSSLALIVPIHLEIGVKLSAVALIFFLMISNNNN